MYTSLSSQMEQYYLEIAKLDGYKVFEKEAWSFKVGYVSFHSLSYNDRPSTIDSMSSGASQKARLIPIVRSRPRISHG
jgi:hypothetical protein